MWRGRPARVLVVEIIPSRWHEQLPAPAELLPGCKRIAHAPESQRARKVITASGRYDQHGQAQPDQLPEMAVNRPIAAEQQDHIDLIGSRRHPHAPLDSSVGLKRLQILQQNIPAREWPPPACADEVSRIYGET